MDRLTIFFLLEHGFQSTSVDTASIFPILSRWSGDVILRGTWKYNSASHDSLWANSTPTDLRFQSGSWVVNQVWIVSNGAILKFWSFWFPFLACRGDKNKVEAELTTKVLTNSMWLPIARFGLNRWLPQSSQKLIKSQTPTCLSHLWEYMLLNCSLLYVVYCWTKVNFKNLFELKCVFVFSHGGATNFPPICCSHSPYSGNFKAHAIGPNIVGPNNVVTCCVRLNGTTTMLAHVAHSLKPVKLLGPCKRTQHCWPTTPNNVGSCWHLLCPFAWAFRL